MPLRIVIPACAIWAVLLLAFAAWRIEHLVSVAVREEVVVKIREHRAEMDRLQRDVRRLGQEAAKRESEE